MASIRCDRCGATQETDGAFCSYCGARLVRPDQTKTALQTATDPARFDLARASPGYELALAHRPRTATAAGIVVPLFCLGFVIVACGMTVSMMHDHPDMSGASKIPFIAIPTIMVLALIGLIWKGIAYARAPIETQLLVVVNEREELAKRGDSRTSTTYFATLQDRDGGRIEHETEPWVAGRIATSDIGVAFLKGGRLVEFVRLEVN